MPSEIDQAAERLRQWNAGEAVYETNHHLHIDLAILADAYLAGQRELAPLEWRDSHADCGVCSSNASTPWGIVSVASNHNGGWRYDCPWFHDASNFGEDVRRPCDSIQHGKQLAEADYRHRVAGLYQTKETA